MISFLSFGCNNALFWPWKSEAAHLMDCSSKKIFLSFTRSHVVANLYDLLQWITKHAGYQTVLVPNDFHLFWTKQIYFSKFLLLCSTEENESYKIGMTWGWVNDEWIFMNHPFKPTANVTYLVPLKPCFSVSKARAETHLLWLFEPSQWERQSINGQIVRI